MAKYDVHFMVESGDYLLDVQSDYLDPMETRIVVPLMVPARAPKVARYLNPIFQIDGAEVVMVTQYMAAVMSAELGPKRGSLIDARDIVTRALDRALTDF